MSKLVPCTRCGAHAIGGTCPGCGASVASFTGPSFAAALLGLAMAGCPTENTDMQALYGVAVQDADGDGYDASIDCDDTNAEIHPGATETVGDDVDSDCDGGNDTSDTGG